MKTKIPTKFIIPAIGAIFGLAAILILSSIFLSPKSGPAIADIQNANPSEVISTIDLQVQRLEKKTASIEENIKKIYSNQVKINESIGTLIQTDESIKVSQKDNRAYIAMIYQRVLDLELQVSSLGGGFNMKSRPKQETINPLIGTDEFPATP